MKKKLSALFLSFILCLSACGSQKADYSDYKITRVETERAVYTDIDELLAASDIVVSGRFCSDAEQQLFYAGGDILCDAVSVSCISVSQVLYGKTSESRIKVSQRYGIPDGRKEIITFSSLLPMSSGDEWIFFLTYDSSSETYRCTGDCCGRMPVFSGEVREKSEKYITLRAALDELLKSYESISYDEIENYSVNGKRIFYNSAHLPFAPDDADSEKASAILEEMESVRAGISPALFGVYDSESINLDLYSDAVSYFNM